MRVLVVVVSLLLLLSVLLVVIVGLMLPLLRMVIMVVVVLSVLLPVAWRTVLSRCMVLFAGVEHDVGYADVVVGVVARVAAYIS